MISTIENVPEQYIQDVLHLTECVHKMKETQQVLNEMSTQVELSFTQLKDNLAQQFPNVSLFVFKHNGQLLLLNLKQHPLNQHHENSDQTWRFN